MEQIAALRERILAAAIQVPWIPALQKDTRIRNAHSSTAIEGNPLTLKQVRAIEEGRGDSGDSTACPPGGGKLFRWIALRGKERSTHRYHARGGLEVAPHHGWRSDGSGNGRAYRTIRVRVGSYVAPPPERVRLMMSDLLESWNLDAPKISPILSSAIVHHWFETIHPFADGNGRAGRMLSLWELYRRGFDNHHIFSIDEFYWEDRPSYYSALERVQQQNGDLTNWIEVQRGRIAPDAGASLEPDSETDGTIRQGEAGASSEAGTTVASFA